MKAEISLPTGSGVGASIKLDGHEVTKAVRALHLSAGVNEVARLELDVVLLDRTEFEGKVDVWIPAASAQLLELIGWTPPNSASPGPAPGGSADALTEPPTR